MLSYKFCRGGKYPQILRAPTFAQQKIGGVFLLDIHLHANASISFPYTNEWQMPLEINKGLSSQFNSVLLQ